MDFGIAKIVDSEKSLTKTGTQIGTVFYMSPEQVKGEKVDHRSDIYSLGVTLFQMITGQCPYNNDTTEFQIYNNIVNDPLPNPATIYPGASKHLGQVIAKATQKNIEDRFQSCEEFKKALNDSSFKTDLKEPAKAEPLKAESKPSVKKPKEKKTATAQPNQTKKKKNTSIIIIAVIALAIAGYYINEIINKESPLYDRDLCDCVVNAHHMEGALDCGWDTQHGSYDWDELKRIYEICQREYEYDFANAIYDGFSEGETYEEDAAEPEEVTAEKTMEGESELVEYNNYISTSNSSQLGNYDIYNYKSSNVVDDNLETWWSPKQNDHNPWIQLSWAHTIDVYGIKIHGGSHFKSFYTKDGKYLGDLYYKNRRLKKILIQLTYHIYIFLIIFC